MERERGLAMKHRVGVPILMLLVLLWLGLAPWTMAQSGVFKGGGGPLVAGALMDLGELERSLQGIVAIQGDFDLGDRSLFLLRGGGGFGGPTLRFGGVGMDGHWSFPVTGESEFTRVTISFGGGGFLIDRVLQEFDYGGVSLGAVIGGGQWGLRFSKDTQGSFEQVIRQPASLELHRSFWFVAPYLSTEYRIFEFVGLRTGVGYWITFSFEDWKIQDGPAAAGGPLRNLGFPFFQLMLVFGGG
jgi:hypothetical protein